jgi:hypothetical protein
MYLLQVDTNGKLSLVEKYGEIPPYGILSHTWIATHEEVTFKDIMKGRGKEKRGYEKLQFCAQQATQDRLDYFWIDTCCIDKSSSAELQEAINSMFKWYQNSARCYVYLADVSHDISSAEHTAGYGWKSAFRRSRWFTRGWTLQELLAPSSVEFFTREGVHLGNKHSLWRDISEATRIDARVLHANVHTLRQVPVNDRLAWVKYRQTTREEDKCYSILGLFNVHMALLYGEGPLKAFRRFYDELKKQQEDPTELKAILALVLSGQTKDDDGRNSMPYRTIMPTPLDMPSNEASERRNSHEASVLQQSLSRGTRVNDTRTRQVQEIQVADASMNYPPEDTHFPGHSDEARLDHEQAQELQAWWNEAIHKNMNPPKGYSHVAVLIIRWEDSLDESKTRSEVSNAINAFI